MTDELPRFGANDFYLVQTDPLALREKLRDALAEVLGREVLDSDPHMVLASAFLPFLVQGQASADAAAKATLRAFAVGADLDRIADSTCVVGYLDRFPARPAVVGYCLEVEVTRNPYNLASVCAVTWQARRSLELSSGETVDFSGAGAFTVDFASTDGASKTARVPVYLVSSATGAAYNGLFGGAATLFPDAEVDGSVSAVDAQGASVEYTCGDPSWSRAAESYGGADAEDDAAFAQRVAWQAKALRVPGSLEYFRLALVNQRLLASCYTAPSVDSDGRLVFAYCDKVYTCAALDGVTLTHKGAAYDGFVGIIRDSLLVEQRAYVYPAVRYTSGAVRIRYMLPAGTRDVASARASVETAFKRWKDSIVWMCGARIAESDAAAAMTAAGAESVWCAGYFNASILTTGFLLPADSVICGYQVTVEYGGIADAEAAPTGSDGEEVTP